MWPNRATDADKMKDVMKLNSNDKFNILKKNKNNKKSKVPAVIETNPWRNAKVKNISKFIFLVTIIKK